MDKEAEEILKWIPTVDRWKGNTWKLNAMVFKDTIGRLCIEHDEGGWLAILPKDFDKLLGDLAPYSD